MLAPLALSLLLSACEPRPVDASTVDLEARVRACDRAEGPAADGCRADLVADLATASPDRALQVARGIGDPATRDLVLLDLVRRTGRDLCREIQDGLAAARCGETMNRPHLDLARPGTGEEGAGLAALRGEAAEAAAPCLAAPSSARVECVDRVVRNGIDPVVAAELCDALGDQERTGECRTQAAEGAVERADIAAARVLCDGIHGRWAGECRFRVAEVIARTHAEEALPLCAQAGEFESECVTHVIDIAARGIVRATPGGTPALQALEAWRQRRVALTAAVPAHLMDQDSLRHMFWLSAWQQLFARASARGELERWVRLPPAAPTDLAQQVGEDILVLTWMRVEVQRRLQAPDGKAPGLAELVAASRVALDPAAAPAADALLLPAVVESLSTGSMLADLVPGAPVQHAFSLGAGALALDPVHPCVVDAPTRELIRALWAVSAFHPTVAEPAMVEGLRHEAPIVRASALSSLADLLALGRNRSGGLPAWVQQELSRVAAQDPSPAMRVAAAELPSQLGHGLDATALLHLFDPHCAWNRHP